MTPISICIIAKNEEQHINHCLSAIRQFFQGYPHEIVIVDTGSTDNTIAIAQKYTDKIFTFQWIDDFSAARNYSLQCATYDWILVLDCDEYIIELDTDSFDLAINQYPQYVGMITEHNHFQTKNIPSINIDMTERFFNRKLYHYEYPIHELVRPIDNSLHMQRFKLPLVVKHMGYDSSSCDLNEKAKRNIQLLLKTFPEREADPYILFQLGQSYNMIHDKKNACHYFELGLNYAKNPQLEYVQTMVVNYGYALVDLGQLEDALLLVNLYDDFSQLADYVCLMGIIYLRNGLLAEAIQEFTNARNTKLFHVEGTNSFIPTYNLGCIHEVLGNIDLAISLYKECGDFPVAKNRLAQLIWEKL